MSVRLVPGHDDQVCRPFHRVDDWADTSHLPGRDRLAPFVTSAHARPPNPHLLVPHRPDPRNERLRQLALDHHLRIVGDLHDRLPRLNARPLHSLTPRHHARDRCIQVEHPAGLPLARSLQRLVHLRRVVVHDRDARLDRLDLPSRGRLDPLQRLQCLPGLLQGDLQGRHLRPGRNRRRLLLRQHVRPDRFAPRLQPLHLVLGELRLHSRRTHLGLELSDVRPRRGDLRRRVLQLDLRPQLLAHQPGELRRPHPPDDLPRLHPIAHRHGQRLQRPGHAAPDDPHPLGHRPHRPRQPNHLLHRSKVHLGGLQVHVLLGQLARAPRGVQIERRSRRRFVRIVGTHRKHQHPRHHAPTQHHLHAPIHDSCSTTPPPGHPVAPLDTNRQWDMTLVSRPIWRPRPGCSSVHLDQVLDDERALSAQQIAPAHRLNASAKSTPSALDAPPKPPSIKPNRVHRPHPLRHAQTVQQSARLRRDPRLSDAPAPVIVVLVMVVPPRSVTAPDILSVACMRISEPIRDGVRPTAARRHVRRRRCREHHEQKHDPLDRHQQPHPPPDLADADVHEHTRDSGITPVCVGFW